MLACTIYKKDSNIESNFTSKILSEFAKHCHNVALVWSEALPNLFVSLSELVLGSRGVSGREMAPGAAVFSEGFPLFSGSHSHSLTLLWLGN